MSTQILVKRVTFCLLAIAVAAIPTRAEEPRPDLAAAVAELKKHNCREIDSGTVTKDTKHLTFGCHSNLPDSALAMLAAFPKLEHLDVISDKVTDDGLKQLKNLPNLRELTINSSTITDKGLDVLKELPKLEGLTLMRTQVTAKGLATVHDLGKLKGLTLMRLKTTPELIDQIKRFKHLDKVYIGQMKFTPEQERELTAALPNLSINEN
jgi:Leucine-rich repeat (LRR) protein